MVASVFFRINYFPGDIYHLTAYINPFDEALIISRYISSLREFWLLAVQVPQRKP